MLAFLPTDLVSSLFDGKPKATVLLAGAVAFGLPSNENPGQPVAATSTGV